MAKTISNPKVRFAGFSDDWSTNEVSHLLEERNVQAPKSEEYPLMAFIAHKGVAPKGDRYNREFLVTDQNNKKYKQTELGDFIYSSNNLETGSIGLNNYGKASISPVYSIFKPTDNADSDFIGRLLTSQSFIQQMVRWRQGVVYGQWRIYESDFLRIKILYPCIKEQSKIGFFLKTFDNKIELSKSKLSKLISIKKSMLEKMFPKNGLDVPEIRFRGFRGSWKKGFLGDESIDIVAGGDIDNSKISPKGKYPVIANALTRDGILGYYKNDYRIKAPAITVTGRGNIGHAKARKVNFTPVVRLLSITTYHDIDFMENVINNHKIVVESTGIPQLTVPQLAKYEIYFPKDDKEEKVIGAFFNNLNKFILILQIEIDKLEKIKLAFFNKMTSATSNNLG